MFQGFINIFNLNKAFKAFSLRQRTIVFFLLGCMLIYLGWLIVKSIMASPSAHFSRVKVPVQAPQPSVSAQHSPDRILIPTTFEEGKHYQKLPASITTNKTVQDLIAEDPGKIQVIEFFNYGCFWCQRLHPVLNEWAKKKPETVVFYRFPVIFNKAWELLAKDYLVVKTLGKNETLDPLFFTEIHQNRVNLSDEKLLKAFLVKHGISEKQFFEIYNSFAVNTEMAKINEIGLAYKVTLSPSVVINTPSGSYFATATMIGSEQGLIAFINYLIVREQSGVPSEKKATHSTIGVTKD
jgi:thiol:disulfide interchange protein DsbA